MVSGMEFPMIFAACFTLFVLIGIPVIILWVFHRIMKRMDEKEENEAFRKHSKVKPSYEEWRASREKE